MAKYAATHREMTKKTKEAYIISIKKRLVKVCIWSRNYK